MLYRCITNIERIFDKKKRQTASFSNIFGKISDFMCQTPGTLRMRPGGSNGGHNGLGNINETIGTQQYCRIRMGIGNNFSRGAQIDYVLGKLSDQEMDQMPELCERVIQGCKDITTVGISRAMSSFNASKKQSDTPLD